MLTVEEITKKLIPVFEAEGVTKATLFGSYAKGTATPESDVDLIIDTEPHIIGFGVYGVFISISDALKSINLELDVIHNRDLRKGGKTEVEVKATGRVIYEKA